VRTPSGKLIELPLQEEPAVERERTAAHVKRIAAMADRLQDKLDTMNDKRIVTARSKLVRQRKAAARLAWRLDTERMDALLARGYRVVRKPTADGPRYYGIGKGWVGTLFKRRRDAIAEAYARLGVARGS